MQDYYQLIYLDRHKVNNNKYKLSKYTWTADIILYLQQSQSV